MTTAGNSFDRRGVGNEGAGDSALLFHCFSLSKLNFDSRAVVGSNLLQWGASIAGGGEEMAVD